MNKKRILLIDDDKSLTQTMKINLEGTGFYEVRIENQSENAHSSAREFRPDLILLDIVMPGLDGGDVCAIFECDSVLQNIPIVMVTALVSNDETGNDVAVTSANLTMVAKPIRLANLIEVIERNLAAAK